MAAKEEEEKEKQAAEEPGPGGPLPQGNFAALVSMLTTQALFALGLIRVRGEEEHEPDLEMARYNIDMLEMLSEKTKGNLTPEGAADAEEHAERSANGIRQRGQSARSTDRKVDF